MIEEFFNILNDKYIVSQDDALDFIYEFFTEQLINKNLDGVNEILKQVDLIIFQFI